ncbi:hypothetical protein J2T13_005127 [Paenibacillus sp. DS2015]|uniref:hypothetical protein n=1 Tax=Paenibacillus sp. DS2015 TaxID=3373917 RepID=UPI003D227F55
MKIENILLTLEQVANDSQLLLVGVNPFKLYENQQVTDKIGGISYECVAPKNKYERLIVKVPSHQPIIENEDIEEDTFIQFIGFIGKFYRDRNGYYQLSCRAEQAFIVPNN